MKHQGGALSYWIVIENQKIKNYHCIVPSTWNAEPRNQKNSLEPYEASLINNPVIQSEESLEVLQTIHSFDSMSGMCNPFI
jgi:hydrogenase large subunit